MKFQCKSDNTKDIFASLESLKDDKEPFAKTPFYAQNARGRIAAQLRHISRTQHRIFAFSGFISTELARLFYCDRSAAAVTEPIRFRELEGLRYLVEFFKRLHRASQSGRGHDDTILPASEDETVTFRTWYRSLKLSFPSNFPSSDCIRVIKIRGPSPGRSYLYHTTPCTRQLLSSVAPLAVSLVSIPNQRNRNLSLLKINGDSRMTMISPQRAKHTKSQLPTRVLNHTCVRFPRQAMSKRNGLFSVMLSTASVGRLIVKSKQYMTGSRL